MESNGNRNLLYRTFWFDSLGMKWATPQGGGSGTRENVINEKGQKAVRPPVKQKGK